jgi:arabinose-5-phosphate isomerase
MTSRRQSRLADSAQLVLCLGETREADPLGLAPTSSTTLMLALGDALALVAAWKRGFTREDFARNHPGGSLGLELARVEEIMRPLSDCRLAATRATTRQVLVASRRPGRRSGAVMLVDEQGRLAGIFTDSDLARIFEQRRDAALDAPILEVMTAGPQRVVAGRRFREALSLMRSHKISELPVVDDQERPLGLIDVTDIVSMMPSGADPDDLAPRPVEGGDSRPVAWPMSPARIRLVNCDEA